MSAMGCRAVHTWCLEGRLCQQIAIDSALNGLMAIFLAMSRAAEHRSEARPTSWTGTSDHAPRTLGEQCAEFV